MASTGLAQFSLILIPTTVAFIVHTLSQQITPTATTVTHCAVWLGSLLNWTLKSRHIFSTVPQKVDTLFLLMFGEFTAASYNGGKFTTGVYL